MKRIVSAILCLITILSLLVVPVGATSNICPEGNHNYVVIYSLPPGPYTDGEEHYECTICGYGYAKILYATNHVWSDWVVDQAPTCQQSGHRYRVCSVGAEHIEEEVLAPSGHSYYEETVEPTCLEAGITIYTCEYCGDRYEDGYREARGHMYESKITTEATESAEGVTTFTCTVCGDTYTEPIPVLPGAEAEEATPVPVVEEEHIHDYAESIQKEATCEEPGEALFECSCGDSYTESIEAFGHDYGEWEVIKKANFTQEGLKRRVCSHDPLHRQEEISPKVVTFEVTPATVAATTVNVGMIGFFLISILADLYVIRWDVKKRNHLKEVMREQRRRLREGRQA